VGNYKNNINKFSLVVFQGKVYAMYIMMENLRDFKTWLQVAKVGLKLKLSFYGKNFQWN